MPTVSNHDVLGPMTWGAGGNARPRYFPQDSLDRSDARSGINSLLFEESGAAGGCAGNGAAPPAEHAYAAPGACQRTSMMSVSANGYYGYHQQHGLAALAPDCSMDTSENNPPAGGGFGGSPSAGALPGFGGFDGAPTGTFPLGPAAQHVWHADPLRSHGAGATRKRSLGGWGVAEPADAEDMAGRGGKRTRPSADGAAAAAAAAMTEAPSQEMAPEARGFGMHVSAPSTSEQSHSPAQIYEVPIHQLPGSTSHLADAMTPRPRCLMGHFI